MTQPIGKFMQATQTLNPGRKTKVFAIHSSMTLAYLGEVNWHNHWRRYWFQPMSTSGELGFDSTCLRDLAAFCDQLMGERITERLSEKRQQLKGQK